MSGMTETWQRDLLAGCLDDWGHPTEAANVRNGEDLESYESDFRLIQKLSDYGLLDATRLRGKAQAEHHGDAAKALDAFNETLVPDLRVPDTLTYRVAMTAALSSTAAPAIGDPINADSDADYLRKLGDRIGGDCGAVLHTIAVSLDAPAPVAGDAVEPIAVALWHRFAPDDRIQWEEETEKAIYRDAAQQVAALAQDRASQAAAPVGVPDGEARS